MNNHFIIPYSGNKRKEYNIIKKYINFDNKKIIIEPFGGSCALSYQIFKEKGNIYTFFLNDLDPIIYQIYKLYKELDLETIERNINNKLDQMRTKDNYNNLKKEELKKNNVNIWTYIVTHKFYSIRDGLFPLKKNMNDAKFIFTNEQIQFFNFMKLPNVYISNNNWDDLFEKYKNYKNCIFFMDPPYIMSCNAYYDLSSMEKKNNVYEFFEINTKSKYKSTIYFILENNWIVRLLFNNHNFIEYEKKYETTKRKTMHMLITW